MSAASPSVPTMRSEIWAVGHAGRWTVHVPTTRRERRRGLLGRTGLEAGAGLLLERCRSVHTVGMRFAIDVVALDPQLRVIAVRTLRPGRLLLPRPGVRHVLELGAGSGVRRGDRFRRVVQASSATSSAAPASVRRTSRTCNPGTEARTRPAAARR